MCFEFNQVGRKALLLVYTMILLLLQALMTSLIQVFNLEEETNERVGYVLTVLLCACAMVYSASWLYVTPNYILYVSHSAKTRHFPRSVD